MNRSSLVVLALTLGLSGVAGAQWPADLATTLLPGTSSVITQISGLVSANDGSNRLFVLRQPGVIRIYDLNTSTLLAAPFLSITVDSTGDEQGLLGLAFHPNFSSNGFFYVNYTYDPGPGLDRTRISRFTVPPGTPNDADESSEAILLEWEQDSTNHNGGDLRFGPDGYLYISVGDGGGSGDTNNRAQTIWYTDVNLRDQALLGSILRIDVDTPPLAEGGLEKCGLVGNYSIPVDNPFVSSSNSCDEIWAYGLRNPWRISFDRWRGDLIMADVGQGTWEEINLEPAGNAGGNNYGWRCREGAHDFNNNPPCNGTLVEPILEYSHTTTDGPNPGGIRCGNTAFACSITGGFRYTGYTIGGLQDRLVFGDYCSGEIFIASESNGAWTCARWQWALAPLPGSLTTFGEGEDGQLYFANRNGPIRRIVSPSAIFADTFESGGLAGWSTAVP